MSADNFIAIVKKGRNYIGYHCSASLSYPYVKCFACLGKQQFKATSLRRSIDLAQAQQTEYGFSIYNWRDEVIDSRTSLACPCETRKFTDELV